MGSKVTVTVAILLLLAYGTEGAVTAVTSNNTAFLVNTTINLTFTGDTLNALVSWEKDSTPTIAFFNNEILGNYSIYDPRLNQSTSTSLLISNATHNDSGSYTVKVSYFSAVKLQTLEFRVSIYDPVTNVTVEMTPDPVSEVTPVVNLTCRAASGAETFTWKKDGASLPSNISSSFLDGNRTLLLNNPKETYNGNYTCNVSNPVNWKLQTKELKVYSLVNGVTVESFPKIVHESTEIVNLTCNASSGAETFTWEKDGASLLSGYNYDVLGGNRTLQIKNPNSTHNGVYTCNASNPASWAKSSLTLVVYSSSSALSTGAIIGIVIGSVCGALLLIALIILIVCCVKRRKGKKEKSPPVTKHTDVLRTVSGNTLSPDDPAFFTVNNIMYRNSSISMGSYNMDQNGNHNQKYGAGWRVLERNGVSTQNSRTPSVNPSINTGKLKHLTQV